MDENETKIALSESWSGWGPAGNTHSTLISEGNNAGLKKGTWSGFVDQMLWAYHSYLACIIYFSPSSQEPFALLLRTQAHSGQCWGRGEGSCQGSWHSKHSGPPCVLHGLLEYLQRAGFHRSQLWAVLFGRVWRLLKNYCRLSFYCDCISVFEVWSYVLLKNRMGPQASYSLIWKPLKRSFNYLLAEVMEFAVLNFVW